MDSTLFIVIVTIIIALVFDVINGFHDSANSIATIVSTRVLSPKFAVLWAAFFNFVAMFVFAPKVADTVSKIVKINPADPAFVFVVLAGLIGAILWDLITWWWGLPTSSSHALLGGFAGAGITHLGMNVINWSALEKAMLFIPLAPILGAILAMIFILIIYWYFRKWKPQKIDVIFRKGQLFSAALYSLGHGGNDAQKTMVFLIAVMVAGGYFDKTTTLTLTNLDTLWIILSCHLAMGIGTAIGGWKIVKTMGMKLTKLKPVHGFAAETAGATTLFLATQLGIPVSTTHTISGAIVGVGSLGGSSGIHWQTVGRILMAWIVTIPASAIMASLCFWLMKILHPAF